MLTRLWMSITIGFSQISENTFCKLVKFKCSDANGKVVKNQTKNAHDVYVSLEFELHVN